MAINSNFSIYNPSAWVSTYLTNQYPMRPILANAATNVAGQNLPGFVASRNQTVKVTRAVKPSGDPNAYSGTYSPDTPDANEASITIDKHYYRQFKIDKADQKFALPDLVQQHLAPRLNNLFDKINQDAKAELRKAEAVFATINTNATVMDTEDIIKAGEILKERKFLFNNLISVVDPRGESDLLKLSLFQEAGKRGDAGVQRSGSMGRAFGFDFFVDNLGSNHTKAVVTDAVVAADAAVGDTELTIDDASAGDATVSLNEGDVVYFGTASGQDYFYTVESQTGTKLTLKEPLRAAVLNNAAIKPVDIASGDTGREEFFYNPGALAVVTAGMSGIPGESGVNRAIGYDPTNRTNFTLSIEGNTSGALITVEALYGIKLFYPDWVVRYIRGNVAKAS